MLDYFTVLRVAASSAAEPASRAAAATHESANGQMTVTSKSVAFRPPRRPEKDHPAVSHYYYYYYYYRSVSVEYLSECRRKSESKLESD